MKTRWQFSEQICNYEVIQVNSIYWKFYCYPHCQYKPKTVKRKIASMFPSFHFLNIKDFIWTEPLTKYWCIFASKHHLKHPFTCYRSFVNYYLFTQHKNAGRSLPKKNALRTWLPLNFVFGECAHIWSFVRQACLHDVNLYDGTIYIR